jgi:foldase protein PrsA
MANRTPSAKTAVKTPRRSTSAARISGSRAGKDSIAGSTPTTLDDLAQAKKRPFLNKKMGILLAIVLGVGLLLFFGSRFLVVAWVDQKPITRFEYLQQLDNRYGKDLKEELIVQKLLENEAQKKNINISNQELGDEIKKIEEQQGGADKLNQILQAQNISRDEFSKLIKLQLMRTKLFSEGASISDEEVNKYIDENKEALPVNKDEQGNDIDPKTDQKLKDSIKEQLLQQKINQSFSTWLQENLQGSRVSRV